MGDKDFQRYFPIARRIEQMMKTDSIAKREVRDKEFWFRQTFITYPRNHPHFGTSSKVLFF
jgi:hypothetical protein